MNENVTVCITPKGEKPVLHFSQFDNERTFTVTVLADDGESAAVLTGLDIEFRLRKTDSHVVTIAPESVADNVITFKTTEQLCACCGQNIASVVLMKDDMIISTLDILVDIQRDILSGGLTSESDIRNLTTQIEQIVPEVVGDDYYNKQEVDDLLAEHTFDPTNYYNKSDVDGLLAAKMDNIGYHSVVDDAFVISFTTDCNAPLDIIKGNITPVQDLHGYTKPWSGGGGKNKLNYDAWKTVEISRGTAVWENNGVTLTATENDAFTNFSNATFPIDARVPITEGETITLSWQETTNTSGTVVIFPNGTTSGMVVVNNAAVKKATYTATSGITFVAFRFGVANSGDTIAYKNIQIEKGSQATSWEPYENICPISGFSALNVTLADEDKQIVESKTVNFGQTVYGGVADVTNGKVTITHAIVDLGDLTWVLITMGDNRKGFRASLPLMKTVSSSATAFNAICSNYATLSGNEVYSGSIGISAWGTNATDIGIYDSTKESMSVSDFKTAMSGVQLVYELATPIEIDTTPETVSSIAGDNNIFLDTGNLTEIAYFEGAEDNLIKLIKACQI